MYSAMIQLLADAEKDTFNTNKIKTSFKAMPGWNDYIKSIHEEVREALILWHMNSKPKSKPKFDLTKMSRERYCKSVETKAQADTLVD